MFTINKRLFASATSISAVLVAFLSLFLAGSLLGQNQVSLEYWEFDDAAGKTFNTGSNNGIINSGLNGTVWNAGGTGGSMETDGNGNFVISNHSGQTYRKIPSSFYSPAYSTGKYRLELNYTSWSLDNSANVVQGMEIVNANNKKVVGFTLAVDNNDNTKGKLQFSGLSSVSTQSSGLTFATQEVDLIQSTAYSVAIEFDFDNDTLEYFADGNSIRSVGGFDTSEFSQLKFFTNSNWNTGSTVTIDSMGLNQFAVPEASTFALIAGFLAFSFVAIRRRKV